MRAALSEEEWVNVAMADARLVVDVLLQLSHRIVSCPPSDRPSPAPVTVGWSHKQRRSRLLAARKPNGLDPEPKPRASPTTALSWSATSSTTDETCRLPVGRSKVTPLIKKAKKKKTLMELKEEENILLAERRTLKTELATLLANIEKEKCVNEQLRKKEMALDERQPLMRDTCASSIRGTFALPDLNLPANEDAAIQGR